MIYQSNYFVESSQQKEMKKPAFIDTMGYTVFSDDLDTIPLHNSKALVINTISPCSYGIATTDKLFEEALKKSDFLVLDGVYFALASILQKGKNIKKNQGPDVFYFFMDKMNKKGGKVFFLGSSESTLLKIREQAARQYPNITVFTYSPPFKTEFSEEDNMDMVNAINDIKPDLVFVGMTAPKQEKWSIQHRDKLKTSLIISIGNVFDWFAGTQKPIHPFWFKLRLGWLVRIFLRPEIFRRNTGKQMIFFRDALLSLFKQKVY
jgi:N-acetylglucosaminyldiphosphoundecaprenol N-acetyl-beta-D-mannosaminyltransferase